MFNNRIPALRPPVLDAGSGTGVLIPFLQEKLNGAGRIYQYDIALNMLREAKKSCPENAHVYYTEGDGHRLSFADESFGTIFCFQFIPHLERKKAAFEEMRRVLLPGGQLYILHFMDHTALNILHAEAAPAMRKHRMPPAKELARTIAAAGLPVAEWEEEKDLYFIRAQKPKVS